MSTQCDRTGLRAALAVVGILSASACSSEVAHERAPSGPPAIFDERPGGRFLRAATDDELVAKREPDLISVDSWADIYRASAAPGSGPLFRELLTSVDTHVCFLSAVGGDLYNGTVVHLRHATNSAGAQFWDLAVQVGIAGANSIMAETVCAPWESFVTEGNGFVWYSDPVNANAGGGCLGRSKEVTVAPDDWGVGFLTKVYGQFEGSEEYGRALHSTSGARPLTLRVHTKQCGAMGSTAREFIAASDPQKTLRSPRYSISSSGTKRQVLIPTRDGVCFLARVSGNMDGEPEQVRISPQFVNGLEMWVAEARAGGGSAYADVQCVYYNQTLRDDNVPL